METTNGIRVEEVRRGPRILFECGGGGGGSSVRQSQQGDLGTSKDRSDECSGDVTTAYEKMTVMTIASRLTCSDDISGNRCCGSGGSIRLPTMIQQYGKKTFLCAGGSLGFATARTRQWGGLRFGMG